MPDLKETSRAVPLRYPPATMSVPHLITDQLLGQTIGQGRPYHGRLEEVPKQTPARPSGGRQLR